MKKHYSLPIVQIDDISVDDVLTASLLHSRDFDIEKEAIVHWGE